MAFGLENSTLLDSNKTSMSYVTLGSSANLQYESGTVLTVTVYTSILRNR